MKIIIPKQEIEHHFWCNENWTKYKLYLDTCIWMEIKLVHNISEQIQYIYKLNPQEADSILCSNGHHQYKFFYKTKKGMYDAFYMVDDWNDSTYAFEVEI